MMEKRLTIGFMDEDAYDEYHNKIAQGMEESARKHDINLIRFGHFLVNIPGSDATQEELLHEFIRQFKLDGLIFLGWARAAWNKDFRERFKDMPMVSLGSCQDGIPAVYFKGTDYIREILEHLVRHHKYRNIAFISPFIPDIRTEAYIEIMKGFGIYDPALIVSDKELEGLNVSERGRKAVGILLDERKASVDAIVSLYNEETYEVINNLKARGIKVPGDIAVTSYEDGEVSRYYTPGMTTVYFPWRELGYYACEAMHRLITKGDLSMRIEVPGKVIYRNSCGCIPHLSQLTDQERIGPSKTDFGGLNESDLDDIAEVLSEDTVFGVKETLSLLKSFKHSFNTGSSNTFLMEFEMYLRKIEFYNEYDEFENIALVFRKTLLPYFLPSAKNDVSKLVWAENIFQQMQMILQNKLVNADFRENLEYNNIKLIMKDVGQILVTNFNLNNLKASLVSNLPRLGVRNCFIYLFSRADERRLFDDYRLEFEYRGGKMVKSEHIRGKSEVCDFDSYLFRENRTYMYLAHLLYLGSDFMGFVLIDPTHSDLRIYRNLTVQIAMALNGTILFDKLDLSYRKLMDQAHRKGMADTTGILHNIANILNSVNVTAQSIDTLMADNAANSLLMANSLLVRNIDNLEGFVKDDPKGKLLMQYYVTLGNEFEIFRGKMQTHIGRLEDKVGLIEGIVNAQQSYTDVKSSLERLEVIPVIEDVLIMHQASMERHGVNVERKYAGSVIALAQRTKLFHILTNIVKNGIESMDKTEPDGRVLTVEVFKKTGGVFIRISDSGEGIAEGNLENIFAYGFTTKKNGHGFGLHSCANYMTEMKGRIWAENKEDGRGAAFVLQFTAPPET